jgi:hypothetical protein
VKSFRHILALTVAAGLAPAWAAKKLPARPASPRGPVVGRPAPAFSAPDVQGKKRSLAEWKGRPVALFFFCGCEACKECAPIWAQVQRSEFMREPEDGSPRPTPVTVVAYLGDAEQTRGFALSHGLDPKRTVLLPDPRNRLGLAYRSTPCPRAWVLDAAGVIRYTNERPDERPQVGPASLIMARAQDALRKCLPAVKE